MRREARAVWLRGPLLALVLGATLLALPACRPPSDSAATPVPVAPVQGAPPAPDPPAGPPLFQDETAGSGVSFVPRNGEESDHYSILETLGCGVALLDYDGDGLLDIFVAGGGFFEGQEIRGCPNRLYKNLGGWKFKDVTAEAGLAGPLFYSHGCAVADYDRDGWPDLLVTGYGRLVLYHNVSDGKGGRRFVDVTKEAGLTDSLWSTSAAWGDVDGDGYPDLYVCHYLDWSFKNNPSCNGYSPDIPRDICVPDRFHAQPHALFHNNRDGTFTNVSGRAGLRQHTADDGKGLGVVIADLNGDRRPEIFVVCDTTDSLLYVNQGQGRFEERGLQVGVARDGMGNLDGSMGVDVGDYDGSGRPSLWVTNYEDQLHSLFRSAASRVLAFRYESQATGIAQLGRRYVGWGTGFFDYDNDGWEDLIVVNGHVFRHAAGGMAQRPVLLHNGPHPSRDGERWFSVVTTQGGSYFRGAHRARGVAIGDLDNDGYPDLVISHVNEPVVVLRNVAGEAGGRHHWLGVDLRGRNHADVVGATVTLQLPNRRLTRFTKGGGSYLSSGDRRLLFGLGESGQAGRLTVAWPSGRTEYWDGLATDQYHRLDEGTGTAQSEGAGHDPGRG